MADAPPTGPEWDQLYELAAAQDGLFTTLQARSAGYSPQLLAHHIRGGRIVRVRRGIYRLVHFPAGEHEELATVWLWSEQAGVLSHETALALRGLSDALPSRIHLTVPAAWTRRRLRVPDGVVLHYAEVDQEERAWIGPVLVTSTVRTLNDLAKSGFSPELLKQAAQQAIARGLATSVELADVERALAPFGGISA
jgi:predicted transcriptional regulator of viral defense system